MFILVIFTAIPLLSEKMFEISITPFELTWTKKMSFIFLDSCDYSFI